PVDKILHLDEANISQAQIDETREHLGLNESVGRQYLLWLGQFVQLDFGESYQTGEPVLYELMFFTPPTFIIDGWSVLLVLLVSFPLGIIAALRYQTWMIHLFVW